MQDDDRKINSWWQSTWAGSYVRTMIFGAFLVIAAIAMQNLPNLGRLIFAVFGFIIAIASYFAAKNHWKKI